MAQKKTAKKETAAKTAPKAAPKAVSKAAAKTKTPAKPVKAAVNAAKAAAVKASALKASDDPEENIKRFAKTPIAMNFVKAHNGAWNHTDWLDFLSDLKKRGYYPIDADRVGLILEDKKKAFFNAK